MAFVLNDRVKETTTSTGTGTINLGGASSGFETFVTGIGNGNETFYCIINSSTGNFEVGIGTVTDATPDTLSRTTVLSSSNSDSLVNFGAGTKDVFCTLPAPKAVVEDGSNNVDIGNTNTLRHESSNIVRNFLMRRELGCLHQRRAGVHRGNDVRHLRKLYEHLVPEKTYEAVDGVPSCLLRRFTDDGKLLLAFSSCGNSFMAFRYTGHRFRPAMR